MVSTRSLERRLGRLGKAVTTHLVFVEDDETADEAIRRYQRDHGKVVGEYDTVHVVSFVEPLE